MWSAPSTSGPPDATDLTAGCAARRRWRPGLRLAADQLDDVVSQAVADPLAQILFRSPAQRGRARPVTPLSSVVRTSSMPDLSRPGRFSDARSVPRELVTAASPPDRSWPAACAVTQSSIPPGSPSGASASIRVSASSWRISPAGAPRHRSRPRSISVAMQQARSCGHHRFATWRSPPSPRRWPGLPPSGRSRASSPARLPRHGPRPDHGASPSGRSRGSAVEWNCESGRSGRPPQAAAWLRPPVPASHGRPAPSRPAQGRCVQCSRSGRPGRPVGPAAGVLCMPPGHSCAADPAITTPVLQGTCSSEKPKSPGSARGARAW